MKSFGCRVMTSTDRWGEDAHRIATADRGRDSLNGVVSEGSVDVGRTRFGVSPEAALEYVWLI